MQTRTAVVTGASRGIGQHIARALADQGMPLLLTARSEWDLIRFAHEIRSPQTPVAVVAVDLADPAAPERIVEAAYRELGRVDVLVNNAAVEYQRRFHTLTPPEIDALVRIDLLAPIQLTRLLLPQMLSAGYGRIVNIASVAGRVGFPLTEAYAASKDGLIAFSRALRNDYRGAGVSATAVVLGAVRDAGLGQRTIEETGVKTNTSFMVRPDKVAAAVLRAIEKDRAEIVVMKGPGRLLMALTDLLPGLGGWLNKASGAEQTMRQVAEFREREHAAATGDTGRVA